jgi:branched-subunit amino acid permease
VEDVAVLIAAIGGLITAVATGITALVKSRKTGQDLTDVKQQVTPANGESLAGLIEEAIEHLRSTSRRVDMHDEMLTRIARTLDQLKKEQK